LSDDDLQRLFSEVADLPPEERLRYFDRQGIPDAVRADVESLLQFDTRRRLPVMDSVIELAAELSGAATELVEGARCGPYVLVRLLGRGGMGAVFLAQRTDGEVEQRVAIKFVPDAAMSEVFRERFLQERQILASLQHSGIAGLLDAGRTASGHPYLVMEYVDGRPIDAVSEGMPLRQMLELFLGVCSAVAYAHRNLIVHRDLKPSNILVDANGQPKLLDFGIARMLSEAADQSVTRVQLLTPEYASPEQVRGAAHSTATDIYSLGAVLYRLLAGRSPHERTPGDTTPIETMICSREPVAPSRVKPGIPRDLDFVVLKALRKEAEERYRSVDALAEDLRAFMDSRPVQARSGGAWYWSRKFVRRRWLPVSAVAAVIASLAIGLSVATRERRIAEDRFRQLRQLSSRVLAVDAAVRNLPGSTNVRQQMVAASMEYLDGLGREARQDRDLMTELAGGYIALAEVQGVPIRPNLGQFAAATESLRKADGFLVRLLPADPGRPDLLSMGAELEQDAMIVADSQHRDREAQDHTERCASYLDRLFDGGRATPAQIKTGIAELANVSLSYTNRHRLDEAIQSARRLVDLSRISGTSAELGQGLSLLAIALRFSGNVDAALPPITEARRLAESTASLNPMTKEFALYGVLLRQGQILGADEGISLNRPDDAIEPLQRAFDLMDNLAAQDPNDSTSRDRAATAGRELGDILRHHDPQRALAIYDRAIQREREQQASARTRREEAHLLARSSYPLRSLGRGREARARIDASFELLRTAGDFPAKAINSDREVAVSLRALADWQEGSGDSAGAMKTYGELLDGVLATRPDVEHDLRPASDLSGIYLAFARVLNHAGQADRAAEIMSRRAGMLTAWDRRLPRNPFVLRQLHTTTAALP
jgi:tRNA A-37 threonylcarbamoyl transferase component Bud32/tetratricopeptide (TPR) repeat protein